MVEVFSSDVGEGARRDEKKGGRVAKRAEKVATRTRHKIAKRAQEKVPLTAKENYLAKRAKVLIKKRSQEKLMQIYLKEAATRTVQKEMTRKDNAGTRRWKRH